MKISKKNDLFLLTAIFFCIILFAVNSAGNMISDISLSFNLKSITVVKNHGAIYIDGNEAL
jgi:hypothetical protein